jgi:heme-degrading monooxygenase HmoA
VIDNAMIETGLSPTRAATVLHRVTGVIDQQQAEQGAAAALRFVLQCSSAHGPIDLVLDLRGKRFETLQAHRAWSQGFARNPALQGHVQHVAIIDDDTPPFHAEQELMETERVRFFVDATSAERWLEQVRQGLDQHNRGRRMMPMIARVWRGIAFPDKTDDYLAHLQHTVFPELSRIEGYRGACVLQRELDGGVEITVQTFWTSMEAIRQFAGEQVAVAVVAPAAQPLFRSYDATVTHFQVVLQAAHTAPEP